MKTEKFIAFQTVDSGGDIWCNQAMLFRSEEAVKEFFTNPQAVVATLEFEVAEHENVDDCIELLFSGGHINGAIIRLEYCGTLKIQEMAEGFVIG